MKKRLPKTTWSYSDRMDEGAEDEFDLLEEQITECNALIAEKAGNWSKASRYWLRVRNYERADLAEEKAIGSLPADAQGEAHIANCQFEKAIEVFRSAGDARRVDIARARQSEFQGQWKNAAEIWQSIGETANAAACLAQHADSLGDWSEAARWYRIAGNPDRAVAVEREARRKATEETGKRSPTLF